MNRDLMIKKIEDVKEWDIIVIGGGATGAGIALDAAHRGLKTLLLEKFDFGKGASSKSTKLIHGGVRYLQQGNFPLVIEALRERGILLKNANHLVSNLPFVVPTYDWWESAFYGLGLKLYDAMAGKYGFGDSKILSRDETLKKIPTLIPEGLRGGVIYYDGQFDDSRLLINILQTAVELGATTLNYAEVIDFIKSNGFVKGVVVREKEKEKEYLLKSKVVINATGVFTDEIRRMDEPGAEKLMEPSRGTHIVLEREFLPGHSAVMVPHTDDGRILFAIPWHGKVLVGTTDMEVESPTSEPIATFEEIEFLLEHAGRYLTRKPEREDILSVFAGLRPLIKQGGSEVTAKISREHAIHISKSGLLTIAGGKWTTYRKMAEDAVDKALALCDFNFQKSKTEEVKIHGWLEKPLNSKRFEIYGSDAEDVEMLCNKGDWYDLIHPQLNIHKGEVIWAVRKEMARSVEDFLARRRRALFLNAQAAIESAPVVAELMAKELRKGKDWRKSQLKEFEKIAKYYLPV